MQSKSLDQGPPSCVELELEQGWLEMEQGFLLGLFSFNLHFWKEGESYFCLSVSYIKVND